MTRVMRKNPSLTIYSPDSFPLFLKFLLKEVDIHCKSTTLNFITNF
jgi:hypothetical protein